MEQNRQSGCSCFDVSKVIVGNAPSLKGGRGQNPFFSTKIVIQTGFSILRHTGSHVTISNSHDLLLNFEEMTTTEELENDKASSSMKTLNSLG